MDIAFIASHPAPKEHFAEFQKVLPGSVLVTVEDIDEVRKVCEKAQKVFVGIGSRFCLRVIQEFYQKVILSTMITLKKGFQVNMER